MLGIRGEEFIVGDHGLWIAQRLEHDHGGGKFVEPQMQDRVVEFARATKRPVIRAELYERVGILGRRLLGTADCDRDNAIIALDVDVHGRIADMVVGMVALQRYELDAGEAVRPR